MVFARYTEEALQGRLSKAVIKGVFVPFYIAVAIFQAYGDYIVAAGEP